MVNQHTMHVGTFVIETTSSKHTCTSKAPSCLRDKIQHVKRQETKKINDLSVPTGMCRGTAA